MKYVSQKFIENCAQQVASVENNTGVEGDTTTKEPWIGWLPKKLKDEETQKKDQSGEFVDNKVGKREMHLSKYGSSINNRYPSQIVDMG